MTNLELAKEQGNQAAPNLLDAIKAGEIGGGGNSGEMRTYVKAIANTKQDLERLVTMISAQLANANIIGVTLSDDTCIYSSYKDWLDPFISYYDAYIEYARSVDASEDEIATILEMRSYLESAKANIPLNTVYELAEDVASIPELVFNMCLFPTPGDMRVVTAEDGDVLGISSYKLGTMYDLDFLPDVIFMASTFYLPVSPLYLGHNTGAVAGHGNSCVCYVDAGDSYDQIVADISDMPDAPDIIRSRDAIRYDAFIIKGVSNGAVATLACVYSLDILSVIDEDLLSSELQTKLAAYKDSVEAEPNKYVCTSDVDLCKHIETCSCIMNTASDVSGVFTPHIRENVIRHVVVSNGADAYSYISTSQLFAEGLFAESDYNTSSGESTQIKYIPSPLK